VAKALNRTRVGRAALLAIAMATASGPACLAVRETRRLRIDGVVLDGATHRPLPGATLLALSRELSGPGREQRRYEAGPGGRIRVPDRHAWKIHPGLSVTIGGPSWINEHYYMAPGYAWIFVSAGGPLGGRPPDRVLLTPLPPAVPRLIFDDAGTRVWEADRPFELRVPPCRGVAQGLSEGGGLLLYWDPRTVVLASSAQEAEGGLWFEGGQRGEPLRAFEGKRMKTGQRAFLDPHSCRLRVEEEGGP